jgi:hypothetical protein
MTTATPDVSAATWPTEDELRAAARKLAKAANAVDELHLTAYRFNDDEDARSRRSPSSGCCPRSSSGRRWTLSRSEITCRRSARPTTRPHR